MTNLLSLLGKDVERQPAGVYVGEGTPKLTSRICNWEFMEMVGLLPEFRATGKETEKSQL